MKNIFIFILFLFFSTSLHAYQAKVIGVSDGDTIKVLKDNRQIKIRLYGIDCPEKRQDFGQKAKQFTSSKVFGKIVEVNPIEKDRYGRTVGLVYINNISLNEELVKSGLAWVYVRYCKEPYLSKWSKYQETARRNKLGLWALLNPVPPWQYRKTKH